MIASPNSLPTQYNMMPEQYREKWGLPVDYPMVAPNYAKARSELAKEMGLGQQRRRGKTAGDENVTKPRAAVKAAARPAKVTSSAPRQGRRGHWSPPLNSPGRLVPGAPMTALSKASSCLPVLDGSRLSRSITGSEPC